MNQNFQRLIYILGVIGFIFILFRFILPFVLSLVGTLIGIALVIVVVLVVTYFIINIYKRSKGNK